MKNNDTHGRHLQDFLFRLSPGALGYIWYINASKVARQARRDWQSEAPNNHINPGHQPGTACLS